jgi:D-3-phosphoglycerate dehydrogenase
MITNVLVTEALGPEGMKVLEDRGLKIVLPKENSQAAFEELLPEAESMVLRTNVTVDASCIEKAPNLKIVARTGAGYDNVDVEAATSRKILVCNLVGVNSVSVAEHAMAMILSLAKQLPYHDHAVREGNWQARRSKASIELDGKTLGVAAMGNIGSKVARIGHDAFGMKVIAFDPYVKEKFADFDYRFVDDLQDLFRESDFLSLHLPSTPETKGVVNSGSLGLMKKGAYLINTARGDLINEADLADALREKRIGGAALDVFSSEPPEEDSPFFGLGNIILTPHVASLTREVSVKAAIGAAQAVVDWADGKTPEFVVNREVL